MTGDDVLYRGEPLSVWRGRWMLLDAARLEQNLLPRLVRLEAYEAAAVARDCAALLRQCGVIGDATPPAPEVD